MKKHKWFVTGSIALLVALITLALAGGLTQAQEPEPEREINTALEVEAAASVPGLIPIQGRLTDDAGNPLNGTYNLTFSLYEQSSGGTALCSDSYAVSVDDGLFEFAMGYCWDDLNGQQVWLGVEVESDGEMTPRQPIYPVPYALSLRPGASISETQTTAILTVRNNGSGAAVDAHSREGHGITSTSNDSDDAAVYGYNSNTGKGVNGVSLAGVGVYGGSLGDVGVEASSGFSVALKATGTGIIQSTADTEIAVSPLDMVPQWESRTDLEFLADGVYMEVRPGASASTFEYIQIPVNLPSELFGTPTKLESVRVCYRCDQSGSYVTTTIVGQGTDSGTINNIINNTTDRTSTSWGCYTVTATTPEEITGSVYIQLSLNFAGTGSAHDIRIGNITLTLTEQ